MGATDSWAGRVVAPTRNAGRHADAVIEQAVVAALRQHAWANMASAFVRDSCVLLCGCIADEQVIGIGRASRRKPDVDRRQHVALTPRRSPYQRTRYRAPPGNALPARLRLAR